MELLERITIDCPYCGEPNALLVDTSAGAQEYIEDCSVCCRPMRVQLQVEGDEVMLRVRSEDELF
jgi:hypothetical protein